MKTRLNPRPLTMKKPLILIAILVIGLSFGINLWRERCVTFPAEREKLPIIDLFDDDEGFSRIDTPWRFGFPRDHGAHSDYKTESWYLTGHLVTEAGRHFGYQLTFFRLGLKPPGDRQRASAWATREVYRGHFALTNVAENKFHATERFSRAALGLSGAMQKPIRIWLENWKMEFKHDDNEYPKFLVKAADAGMSIDLTLQSLKPPILSGDEEESSLSFYAYSLTRLMSQGTIRIGSEIFQGEGLAWLDRAWGWAPLPDGPVVWDRFLLHLDDGSEVMGFKLRRRAGGGKPVSSGMRINPDGTVQRFGSNEVTIDNLDEWINPRDHSHYPARWRIRIPRIALDLEVIPQVVDQALEVSMRYWGGNVYALGELNGQPINAQGFVELTGYVRH